MTSASVSYSAVPIIPSSWRTPARWFGGGFLLALLVLFIVSLPTRYTELTQICNEPECPVLWLTPDDAVALDEMGISIAFYAAFQTGIEVAAVALCAVLALFIFRYHSHTWMGLMTAIVVLAAPIFVLNAVWTFIQTNQQYALAIEIIQDITIIAFFGFMHLFPNGRFAPRWSRWNLLLIAIWQIVTFINLGDPTEFYSRELYGIGFAILGILGLILIGTMIYRYRRVLNAEQKQQVKWVLFAIFINILGAVDWILFFELFPPEPGQARILNYMLHYPFALATQVVIPVAITIAILRYRLWDVDVLINRTLVYTTLTVLLILLYVIIVTFLNAAIQSSNTALSSLLAAGIIAVSFHDIRERIQQGVNRLMFGRRDEPHAVLMELSSQLSTVLLPQDLLNTGLETIGSTLKLPYAAITIHRGEAQMMQAEYGINKTPIRTFSLIYQNEAVGELRVGQRSPNEPLNPADETVIAGIAQQLGAVVYAVRLQTDLQSARERLVIAREEERRRLRRDLHDGLGPALASQPLQFDIAIESIPANPDQAIDMLKAMKQNTQGFVSDIRRIIHDLRPPALDELGLVAALQSAISSVNARRLDIQLQASDISRQIPAATEAAAYHLALEAVTNVIKHAQATHCWVRLEALTHPPGLQITIEDDGVGIPTPVAPNIGLHSMRERAEELGGSFEIRPINHGGTYIRACVPLPEERKRDD